MPTEQTNRWVCSVENEKYRTNIKDKWNENVLFEEWPTENWGKKKVLQLLQRLVSFNYSQWLRINMNIAYTHVAIWCEKFHETKSQFLWPPVCTYSKMNCFPHAQPRNPRWPRKKKEKKLVIWPPKMVLWLSNDDGPCLCAQKRKEKNKKKRGNPTPHLCSNLNV